MPRSLQYSTIRTSSTVLWLCSRARVQLQAVGIMIGGMTWGRVVDTLGRRHPLMLVYFFVAIFGCLGAAAPSYWWFVADRMALGFFLSGFPQMCARERCAVPCRAESRRAAVPLTTNITFMSHAKASHDERSRAGTTS